MDEQLEQPSPSMEHIDISGKQDRGVLKKILREGRGDFFPLTGDTVIVHYVGTYYGGDQHGEKFDSSIDRKEKFKFTIGKGDVIKGWDIGVATMKLGEKCELIVSSDYGYMDDKTMMFEVELFDFHGSDVGRPPLRVFKSTIEKGRDTFEPSLGLNATVYYKCISDPTNLEGSTVSYQVGDADVHLPLCIDLAVQKMNTGERCRVRCVDSSIPDDSEKFYEVHLKSFDKLKRLSVFSKFSEQMDYADKIKHTANDYLKASKYDIALNLYKSMLPELDYTVAKGDGERKRRQETINALQLNCALVYLKLGNDNECRNSCERVLECDPNNEKALFRLGQACLLRKDHEEALSYFRRVVSVNPLNSAALNQVHVCERVLQRVMDEERKRLSVLREKLNKGSLVSNKNDSTNVTESCAS